MGEVLEFPEGAPRGEKRALAEVLRDLARDGVVITLEMTPDEARALADALDGAPDRSECAWSAPARSSDPAPLGARLRQWWRRATGRRA